MTNQLAPAAENVADELETRVDSVEKPITPPHGALSPKDYRELGGARKAIATTFSSAFSSGVVSADEYKEVRRDTFMLTLREIAEKLKQSELQKAIDPEQSFREKEACRKEFLEAILSFQAEVEHTGNLLVHIVQERMKATQDQARSAQEGRLAPADRPMNVAGFIRRYYHEIRKTPIDGEPAYYRLFEELCGKLLTEPLPSGETSLQKMVQDDPLFQAMSAITIADIESRATATLDVTRTATTFPEVITENEETIVYYIGAIENYPNDDEHLFPVGEGENMKRMKAGDAVDLNWIKFCEKQGWVEAFTELDRATGPYLIIVDRKTGKIKASASLLESKNFEKYLSVRFFGDVPVEKKAIEQVIAMLEQNPDIDTSSLKALLDRDNVTVKEFMIAKKRCTKKMSDGTRKTINIGEVIRLALDADAPRERLLADVYDAIHHIVTVGKARKVDCLNAQAESFPICIALEIIQALQDAKKDEGEQRPVICYTPFGEVNIDNGTSTALPTILFTAHTDNLHAAFKEIEADGYRGTVLAYMHKLKRNAREPGTRRKENAQGLVNADSRSQRELIS